MKSQIKNRRLCPQGFTLLELLVVIALIAILAALMLPALRWGKASARSAACRSNLRQIGIGLRLYVDESAKYPLAYALTNGGVEVPGSEWNVALLPHCGGDSRLLVCPAEPVPFFQGPYRIGAYWYNMSGTEDIAWPTLGLGYWGGANVAVPESRVLVPSDMIAIGELGGFGYPGVVPWYDLHGKAFNAVFCDGHAESGNPYRIPWTNYTYRTFKPDIAHARRWNNDNQPHAETWP